MKKVLWVSRHQMTWEQRADLERIMGGPPRDSSDSLTPSSPTRTCSSW